MDIVRIIKKNIVIIIPAAIAVVALLLLVPSVMIRGKINTKLEESVLLRRSIDSELRNAISSRQSEVAKKYQDAHQIDANEIDKLSMQTSRRELLSYKIFPEPNETSMQIFNEFKRAYNVANSKFISDLKALDAPTDNEIRKLAGSIDIAAGDSAATPGTAQGDEKIVELICKSRSEEIPVYANPWVFSGYSFFNNWEDKSAENAAKDCWYCQLACWIHQDIVDTINSLNAGSTSVANSSVKRILAVRFSAGGGGDINRGNGLELPVYVTKTKGGLCQPWTGRMCDEKNDVVHFNLAVIVRANDILKFMSALNSEKEHTFAGFKGELPPQKFKHNQITILQSRIEPVDRNSQENKRYYYGQNAVVYLNLICEYVFNRQGYDVIKPKLVADEIAGVEANPEMSAPPGGAP